MVPGDRELRHPKSTSQQDTMSKTAQELDWQTKVELAEGIRRTMERVARAT